MKKVYEYAVEVTAYNHSDYILVSRQVYFTDRRKALSYYQKALAFWNPENGHLNDYDLKRVDMSLTSHFDNDSCDTLFIETITY